MQTNYKFSDVTDKVIKAFYNVYNELGYGFLERVYESAMLIELREQGVEVVPQHPVPVYFKQTTVGKYYADLMIEGKVIVELKSVEYIRPEHEAQLVNYLRASDIEVGLILNFGPVPHIKRRVLTKGYKKNK